MRKIITWLYNRYCRPQIDSLYLRGIQREFGTPLDIHQEQQRAEGCTAFVESKALELVINEVVRDYVELLFNTAEKQSVRDLVHNNINVVLGIEDRIKMHANKPQPTTVEDPYNPL